MMWRKAKSEVPNRPSIDLAMIEPEPVDVPMVRVVDTDGSDNLPEPAQRTERVLAVLAIHAEQMEVRLSRLEDQIGGLTEALVHPEDLVENEVRTARVSAEVSRVEIELRAEVDALRAELAELAGAKQRARLLDQAMPTGLIHTGSLVAPDAAEPTNVVEIHSLRDAS